MDVEGNKAFRDVVAQYKKRYVNADLPIVKKTMVKQVQKQLSKAGFRFVERKGGLWVEASPKKSHRKIVQALREGAPGLRKVPDVLTTDPATNPPRASPFVKVTGANSTTPRSLQDKLCPKGLLGSKNGAEIEDNHEAGSLSSGNNLISQRDIYNYYQMWDQDCENDMEVTEDYIDVFLDLFGLLGGEQVRD